MADEIDVLCGVHHTPMAMILQGYVDIAEWGMETTNRRMNQCPKQRLQWHGSMASVAVKDGEFVWKCLHQERGNTTVESGR